MFNAIMIRFDARSARTRRRSTDLEKTLSDRRNYIFLQNRNGRLAEVKCKEGFY